MTIFHVTQCISTKPFTADAVKQITFSDTMVLGGPSGAIIYS